MAQQHAMASSQSEGLLVPLQLVDGISTTVSSVNEGFGLSVCHWVAELFHFAANLEQSHFIFPAIPQWEGSH